MQLRSVAAGRSVPNAVPGAVANDCAGRSPRSKKMTTKRSQAAMNLKGGFKLITTGTPIENHLEFVPLYQSWASGFNQRFAIPIESFRINRYAAN